MSQGSEKKGKRRRDNKNKVAQRGTTRAKTVGKTLIRLHKEYGIEGDILSLSDREKVVASKFCQAAICLYPMTAFLRHQAIYLDRKEAPTFKELYKFTNGSLNALATHDICSLDLQTDSHYKQLISRSQLRRAVTESATPAAIHTLFVKEQECQGNPCICKSRKFENKRGYKRSLDRLICVIGTEPYVYPDGKMNIANLHWYCNKWKGVLDVERRLSTRIQLEDIKLRTLQFMLKLGEAHNLPNVKEYLPEELAIKALQLKYPDKQKCDQCGQTKPLNYFRHKNHYVALRNSELFLPSHFYTTCIVCMQAKRYEGATVCKICQDPFVKVTDQNIPWQFYGLELFVYFGDRKINGSGIFRAAQNECPTCREPVTDEDDHAETNDNFFTLNTGDKQVTKVTCKNKDCGAVFESHFYIHGKCSQDLNNKAWMEKNWPLMEAWQSLRGKFRELWAITPLYAKSQFQEELVEDLNQMQQDEKSFLDGKKKRTRGNSNDPVPNKKTKVNEML